MTRYIIELIEEFEKTLVNSTYKTLTGLNVFDFIQVISKEISEFSPRDFLPNERYKFITIRQHFSKMSLQHIHSGDSNSSILRMCGDLRAILLTYGLYDNDLRKRTFDFLHDAEQKTIIERDYLELSNILMPDGAWKSAVIMSGSILEAILFDVLSSPLFGSRAIASSSAPRTRRGIPIDMEEWKLKQLIEVATEIGVLSSQRSNSIDQVLRDYRNFVHPKKEIKSEHPCSEAEALMAKGGLDGVCNHLQGIIT